MYRLPRIAACLVALPGTAIAQNARDAAATLGRDVARPAVDDREKNVPLDIKNVESPAAANAPAPGSILVGSVLIEGGREIPRDSLAPAFESFVGRQADGAVLQAMARAIADRARSHGYLFASAMVPQQQVSGGTVTVVLDAGRIDAVRVTGASSRRLQRILDRIVGPAVLRDTFERQLLIAGDIPGIEIVSTRYAREDGRAVLVIEAREDRLRGSATVDNFGPDSLGPLRTRIRVDYSGLLDDDVLSVQAINTTTAPHELAYASVRYTHAIGDAGTQAGVALAAGGTRPGGSDNRLTGKSRYAALFASHPLIRSAHKSLWVNAELAWLRVDQNYDRLRMQQDEIVTVTLTASGNARLAGGWLSGALGIVQGLGIEGTTAAGDPTASRPDGSARFSKGIFWLDWNRQLGGGTSIRLSANGQIANRPLLAAQEIGLGGPGIGRGYDFSERFGDDGVLGAVELGKRFPKPAQFIDWVLFYGFADGGRVWNLDQGFGGGTLFSGGGGLRGAIGKTEFTVEAAYPLSGPRYDSGNRAPRINVSLGHRF
jgi:hemolysin activation/secretion protein